MAERLGDYEYGDPCPECGESERFGETCKAHGSVYFNEDGQVVDFKHTEFGETLQVECLECETILIDK